MKAFTLLLISFLLVHPLRAQPAPCKPYDVIVYGGSSAGFTAAIQVARSGKTVALLEPSRHVGGMNVEGLGGTDIDNHAEFQNSAAVGGLALEFYQRVARHYNRLDTLNEAIRLGLKRSELWRFEPHVAEKVIREWLSEYKIDIFLNTRLAEDSSAVILSDEIRSDATRSGVAPSGEIRSSATRSDATRSSVTRSNTTRSDATLSSVTRSGATRPDSRIREIRTTNGECFTAAVFIDATVEGDLMAAAGVSYVVGRESNRTYGERFNGIRENTLHAQFQVNVDPYRVPGDKDSGLIPTIQDEPPGRPGEADHRIQAYCFRVCLTKDSANRIPFERPAAYDRDQYEIYLRYLRAGGRLYTPWEGIPNRKTDLGAWHDLSHNLYGMNHGYPGGSYAERDALLQYHRNFTQGLFYFFANDKEVGQLAPGFQAQWAAWGLPRDEFRDNGGWPRMFYVRDARRMVSDYVITEHHVRRDNPAPVDDPVAIAYWPPDVHSVRRIVKDGKAYNEGFVFGGRWWRPFGISYQAIVPRRQECTNLLVPSCPSSSHIAYGAIRIEFTFMALGQAAALAAVLAIEKEVAVQDVPYPDLNKGLIETHQIIYLN